MCVLRVGSKQERRKVCILREREENRKLLLGILLESKCYMCSGTMKHFIVHSVSFGK